VDYIAISKMLRDDLESEGLILLDLESNSNPTWLCVFDKGKHDIRMIERSKATAFACRGTPPLELINILKSGIDNPTRNITWLSNPQKALEYGKQKSGQLLTIYDWKYFLSMAIKKENIGDKSKQISELYEFPFEINGIEYLSANENWKPAYDMSYGRLIDPTKQIHPVGIIFIAENKKQVEWLDLGMDVYSSIH